jgi:hypothetical protein
MAVPIIFLSHSSHDHDIARALKGVLSKHTEGEIQWWLSSDGQSIRGGKHWRSEVEQALRDCKIVFILFTATSSRSAWVQYEAGFADALEKDIIPVALPTFDIDGIPGPLQHKQGFNIRDSSGLNNIVSHVNRILGSSYLQNLGEDHYTKVFGERIDNASELSALLGQYFETITVEGVFETPVFDAVAQAAQKVDPEATALTGDETRLIIGGSGFTLQQTVSQDKGRPGSKTPEEVKTTYLLTGEISPLMLLEVLTLFSAAHQAAGNDGIVSLKWNLRSQVGMPTRAAEILARMRGTPMKFFYEDKMDYGGLAFAPASYNANAPSVWNSLVRRVTDDSPEPYRPPDIRFRIFLSWYDRCPEQAIRDLLTQLFERNVITNDARFFDRSE